MQSVSINSGATLPRELTPEWLPLLETYTSDETTDEWGLRAGVIVARYRKRSGRGPTFRELFEELEREGRALSGIPWPDGVSTRRAVYVFQWHCAVHWRRRGWICWSREVRSLRPGPRFRVASKAWIAARKARRLTPVDNLHGAGDPFSNIEQ